MRTSLILLFVFSAVFFTCNSSEQKGAEPTVETQDSATFQPSWKLAIQLWTFNISTFYDAIDKVDSCGVKYIEVYPGQKLSKTDTTGFGPAMSHAQRDSVKALISRRGLTITSFGVTGAN